MNYRAEALLMWGGTVEMPCLESSARTLSVEGGFRPNGNGSHGLFIASFTILSITSSSCHSNMPELVIQVQIIQVWHLILESFMIEFGLLIFYNQIESKLLKVWFGVKLKRQWSPSHMQSQWPALSQVTIPFTTLEFNL